MPKQCSCTPQDRLRTASPRQSKAPAVVRGVEILSSPAVICNHKVLRRLGSGKLQAKLAISQPSDEFEQEADRVAEQVMSMPEPRVKPSASMRNQGGTGPFRRRFVGPGAAGLAEGPEGWQEPQVLLRRGTRQETTPLDAPLTVRNALQSPGQPLDRATR